MQLQSKRSYFLTSGRLNLTPPHKEKKPANKINKEGKKRQLKSTQQKISQQKIKTKSTATKQKQAKQTCKINKQRRER